MWKIGYVKIIYCEEKGNMKNKKDFNYILKVKECHFLFVK